MRLVLALGGLAFAMMIAGVPAICDSRCVARAEGAPPASKTMPDDSGVFPIPVEHQLAQHQFESIMRALRQLDHGKPSRPLRGDFWTDDELKRHFDPPFEW